jgi:hypothetical protein
MADDLQQTGRQDDERINPDRPTKWPTGRRNSA